ncbi:MAG: hypothetical protein HOY71_14235 [Nonomuraea sp.]|nr:hypothetical protein [Nonomuraea sp.]
MGAGAFALHGVVFHQDVRPAVRPRPVLAGGVRVPTPTPTPSPSETVEAELETTTESEKRADGPSKDTDAQAAAYFKAHWNDGATKRLRDIRTVGGYLRIYTDLPESAHNSGDAIKLCERGLAYLRERGVEDPIVFVQAEYGENGNPVLANIIGPADRNCRLTDPDPN